MELKYSVGLDVSSKKINGCISVINEKQHVTFKSKIVFSNNLEDWIVKWHKAHKVPLVIYMEATGIYHENCALYLFEKNYKTSIVLPNKAKKYLECLGLKSKND